MNSSIDDQSLTDNLRPENNSLKEILKDNNEQRQEDESAEEKEAAAEQSEYSDDDEDADDEEYEMDEENDAGDEDKDQCEDNEADDDDDNLEMMATENEFAEFDFNYKDVYGKRVWMFGCRVFSKAEQFF